ncbi:hypothetical protein HMPREF0670_01202 [Prevotella sp. oral taxon 317 str. F0108]|nr:hypothetical protein HMPREF0670_01202 [Prevotella sp. oral taxon 317 str. F0108]
MNKTRWKRFKAGSPTSNTIVQSTLNERAYTLLYRKDEVFVSNSL